MVTTTTQHIAHRIVIAILKMHYGWLAFTSYRALAPWGVS